jgi:hypothetical protein
MAIVNMTPNIVILPLPVDQWAPELPGACDSSHTLR